MIIECQIQNYNDDSWVVIERWILFAFGAHITFSNKIQWWHELKSFAIFKQCSRHMRNLLDSDVVFILFIN